MAESMFKPGCKVRVVNPQHWLFDKVGHVVKMSLDSQIKHQMAGGARHNRTIVVDFDRPRKGIFSTPIQGPRPVHTHNCDGSLSHNTGYYMLERDLKLEDVAGGVIL